MIVDSSGAALQAALDAGVYIVKPSLRELREFTAAPLETEYDQLAACRSLIASGRAEMVALTLGDRGALVVDRDRALRARAVPVKPASVVGAGDSFLGAMIWSLAAGHSIEDAFRYGMAAGRLHCSSQEPGSAGERTSNVWSARWRYTRSDLDLARISHTGVCLRRLKTPTGQKPCAARCGASRKRGDAPCRRLQPARRVVFRRAAATPAGSTV